MNQKTNQNKSSTVNFGVEIVKEFAVFLHQNDAIKFGDFTLSSGKKSSYYVDLRVVPSFPHQFRKMVKALQALISDQIGYDNFDCLASVPTGGLVIASALAIETVKPLVYVIVDRMEVTDKILQSQGVKSQSLTNILEI